MNFVEYSSDITVLVDGEKTALKSFQSSHFYEKTKQNPPNFRTVTRRKLSQVSWVDTQNVI